MESRAVRRSSSTRPASLGIGIFVVADAMTFAALLAAALVARAGGDWRAPGDPAASLAIGGILTAALLAASAILLFGRGRRWASGAAAACGAGFVLGALLEWRALGAAGLAPGNSRFADAFFVITGYHLAHVAAGVVALVWLAARPPRRPGPTVAIGWYWHFIDAIWLAIAATFYLQIDLAVLPTLTSIIAACPVCAAGNEATRSAAPTWALMLLAPFAIAAVAGLVVYLVSRRA